MTDLETLFSLAVDPDSVLIDPNSANYTVPHTWGVYEVLERDCGPSGMRFRKGNHPVRLKELQRELGNTKLVALFTEEELASELSRCLTERSS